MGVFGVKIYEDDIALDVKEEYLEKLRKGIEDKTALKEIIKEYKDYISDIDEGPVFWIALADTMWKVGRLTEKVKREALNAIDKNLIRWKKETNEKEYKLREKELLKFKDKINTEMPSRKIYIKKEKRYSTKNISKSKFQWKIGEIYAYKLESDKAKELNINNKFLLFRKIDEARYGASTKAAIVYTQITKDCQLPKEKNEIQDLEYIIISNEGNVRYQYKMELYNITQKVYKEKLIYIGNFPDLKKPEKEYEPLIIKNDRIIHPENIDSYPWKYIDTYFLENFKRCGTNKHPVNHEIDPRNIDDSKIRFLMRARYYEEKLEITPPEGAIVKDDPLLYIALVDSMMVGGIVLNPVGPLTDDMKQEAYKRIEELKNIIEKREDKAKEEKLKILEELKTKIENFNQKNIFPYM